MTFASSLLFARESVSNYRHARSSNDTLSTQNLTFNLVLMLLYACTFSALVLLDYWTGMQPSHAAGSPMLPALVVASAIMLSLVSRWNIITCGLAMLFCWMVLAMYGLDVGYAVHRAGRGFPLVDPVLSRIDLAMGYDWPKIFAFFVRHPDLTNLTRIPYDGTRWQTAFVVVALMALGHHRRLIDFASANFLSLFLVHLIALFLPALGTYAHAGLTVAAHPDVYSTTRAEHVPSLLAVRNAVAPDLNAFQRYGIVTFPSYHTVTIVQFVWAFWRTRVLRWLAIGWNGIVLVATPAHGSHYLCDILVGAAVAVVSLHIAATLPGRCQALWVARRSTLAFVRDWQRSGGAFAYSCVRRVQRTDPHPPLPVARTLPRAAGHAAGQTGFGEAAS